MSDTDAKNEAFLALLRPLQQPLENYCRRMLRNPAHVEDVLQSAVLEAFARFDRYTAGTNFRAWMFRFVTLELFNRNRKREPVLLGDSLADLAEPAHAELPDNAVSLLLEDPQAMMDHFDDQICGALRQLTPLERAVFLLRAMAELSYQEIHDVMSLPLGSVMGYLSRARRKLRQALAEFAAQRGLAGHFEEPR